MGKFIITTTCCIIFDHNYMWPMVTLYLPLISERNPKSRIEALLTEIKQNSAILCKYSVSSNFWQILWFWEINNSGTLRILTEISTFTREYTRHKILHFPDLFICTWFIANTRFVDIFLLSRKCNKSEGAIFMFDFITIRVKLESFGQEFGNFWKTLKQSIRTVGLLWT